MFNQSIIPQGGVLVDVGGGIGTESLTLAQFREHLVLVVQDREPVIQDAIKVLFKCDGAIMLR